MALGKSRAWSWPGPDSWEEALALHADLTDAYQRQCIAWTNRIEAWLTAHWPELPTCLGLTSLTLLRLLARYGNPQALVQDSQAAARLQRWGSHFLLPVQIERILASARATLGVPVTTQEAQRVQRYALEALRARLRRRAHHRALAGLVESHPVLPRLAAAVGAATAAVLWVEAGDPAHYVCGRAYLKALGLNLTERSSGAWQGAHRVSKRGSSRARRWLYFAALRWVRFEPVKSWYTAKVARDGGVCKKGLAAIMRRLALTLHALAKNGSAFEAARLYALPARSRRARRRAQG